MKRLSWEWKFKSQLTNTHEAELSQQIEALRQEVDLSPVTLRVCMQRGLDSASSIRAFLAPRLEHLKDPFSLQGMEVAVQRLVDARALGQRIRIFGDYDVDGTTGTALLSWVFRDFGLHFDARQPDRFTDGYGLSLRAVEEAFVDGVHVLLTVDCGITSFQAAKRAQELGIDLLIVDHHAVDPLQGLPVAHAVINPQRPDCTSGLKQLCGCGLAFYLAIACRARGRQEGWFNGCPEPQLKQHLDLVVLATAADLVPLTGDNHILVRYGLEVLKKTAKPGVKALLRVAGLEAKEVTSSHLGFVLGPRINASGRISSASLALELLTTTDENRAEVLAEELEQLNQERMNLQNQIWDEVKERVTRGIEAGKYRNGVVVADTAWHEGVVGIVASRVTELFHRPAIVISLKESTGKGSVRSFGGKDVLAALRQCESHLLGFGGHRHAAGLSLDAASLEAFTEAFDEALGALPMEKHASALWIEAECDPLEVNSRSIHELEQLGPFGPGNPEPLFMIRASVRNHRVLKERHLKLHLALLQGVSLEAIWFHGAERVEEDMSMLSEKAEEREWVGSLEFNRYLGQLKPSFRVKDWRKCEVKP